MQHVKPSFSLSYFGDILWTTQSRGPDLSTFCFEFSEHYYRKGVIRVEDLAEVGLGCSQPTSCSTLRLFSASTCQLISWRSCACACVNKIVWKTYFREEVCTRLTIKVMDWSPSLSLETCCVVWASTFWGAFCGSSELIEMHLTKLRATTLVEVHCKNLRAC